MNFKVLGIEHVGIATNNESKKLSNFFKNILKLPLKKEIVKNQKVLTKIFDTGNGKIELLSATEENSVINKFLDRKGESIHHLAVRVDNIFNAIEYLQENGIELINKTPQEGADNMNIIFIHPNSTPGLLLELCQNK